MRDKATNATEDHEAGDDQQHYAIDECHVCGRMRMPVGMLGNLDGHDAEQDRYGICGVIRTCCKYTKRMRRQANDQQSSDHGDVHSKNEAESFLLRLHTGEVLGDGGAVLGMLWGMATLVITVTGLVIYWRMRRPGATGTWIGRVFW